MVAHIMEADNTQLMEPSSPLRKEVSKQKCLNSANLQQSYSSCVLPRGLDVDYVRNILLKYLEYMASGENEKEALTLEKVLFTVLNATQTDLASLESARQKNNTGIMSYFYDLPNTRVAKPVKTRQRGGVNNFQNSPSKDFTKRQF